jgi:hypothetical protein
MFSATNCTTVLGSPIEPITTPTVIMVNANPYTTYSGGVSKCSSAKLVTRPSTLAPTFPPAAQAPPESRRRLSAEPLKSPITVGPKRGIL